MTKKLYILPSFKSSSEKISTNFYQAMNKHNRVNKMLPNNKYIPAPVYEQLAVEEIVRSFDEGLVYPEDSVYEVASEVGQGIQVADVSSGFKKYKQLITEIQDLEDDLNFFRSSSLDKHNQGLQEYVEYVMGNSKNLVPVLSIDNPEVFSMSGDHIKLMGNKDKWVEDLIFLFSQFTESNIAVDPSLIDYDSFLFDKNGGVAAFIDFAILIFGSPSTSSNFIIAQNLKAFSKLLSGFYDYYDFGLEQNPSILNYNSAFSKLYQRIHNDSGISFSSFAAVHQFFRGQENVQKPTERIGVFLDVANIYTDLKNIQIDYPKLFTSIYGREGAGNIKDKFAFLFNPVYESETKTKRFKEKQKELSLYLKKQGFEIETSGNDTARAKQIINGQEHDEDDFKLIQRMEERFAQVTSVLLFSGDEHYYDILLKYQKSGKKVKVISTHPDSTSNLLTTSFDHSYIFDYWDCILL